MAQFWQQFSGQRSTVKEMMLDTSAVTLDTEERPEILSYLPDCTHHRVIELGAGIGRFTGELALKAQRVVAVDFMAEFMKQNEQTNKRFGNIEFVCTDVTSLSRKKNSADLVFSNWLLMYLDSTEVRRLLTNILTWLTPGGHLFLRESCRQPSGDMPINGDNPTYYRDSSFYEEELSSVTVAENGDKEYGFEVVMSKSVDTYVKHKNQGDQKVWLVQKSGRDRSRTLGFNTLQQFLHDQYSVKTILGYEKLFGRNFVSPGGLRDIQEFVSHLKLQPGEKVLDAGGGLGGSAFYMAQWFEVQVLSVDLSSLMTDLARERAQELDIGSDQVSFEVADVTKRDYAPHSFDVIISREALTYVEDKLSLYKKFFRWLKPGGRLLVTDRCCSQGPHCPHFQRFILQRGFHLLTVDAHGQLLREAGFVEVRAEDRSQQFLYNLQTEFHILQSIREEFSQEFSEEDHDIFIEERRTQQEMVQNGHNRWGFFYAEKQQL